MNNDNEIKTNNEPTWVTDIRNQYKSIKKSFKISALVCLVICIVFVFLAIFIENLKFIYIMGASFFGLLSLFLLMGSWGSESEITCVEVIDGYYVVGNGGGSVWSLIIDGIAQDSSVPSRHHFGAPNDVVLKGTLPNGQRIRAIFGSSIKNFMKIEKVTDEEK